MGADALAGADFAGAALAGAAGFFAATGAAGLLVLAAGFLTVVAGFLVAAVLVVALPVTAVFLAAGLGAGFFAVVDLDVAMMRTFQK